MTTDVQLKLAWEAANALIGVVGPNIAPGRTLVVWQELQQYALKRIKGWDPFRPFSEEEQLASQAQALAEMVRLHAGNGLSDGD